MELGLNMSVVLSALAQCSALMLLILWIGATATDPSHRVEMSVSDRIRHSAVRCRRTISVLMRGRR